MTTSNPDKPFTFDDALRIMRDLQEGKKVSKEEIQELVYWINTEFMPAVRLVIDELGKVMISALGEMKAMIDTLPAEVRRQIMRESELHRAKAAHPSRKVTTISPLERALRANTMLVPDGPDYMKRNEQEIQRQLSEAGITANVMPLSQHPAYGLGLGRINR